MAEESAIYKYTLLKKREFYFLLILVFSVVYIKFIEIYSYKFFATSVSDLDLAYFADSGELPFIYLVSLWVIFCIDTYYFLQFSPFSKKSFLPNFVILGVSLIVLIFSILGNYGSINLTLFIYLIFILLFGFLLYYLLAYLYIKSLDKIDIESLQPKKLEIWFDEEFGNIFIVVICAFLFGWGIIDMALKNAFVYMEAEKIIYQTKNSKLTLLSDQYDLYSAIIIIYYIRLMFGRVSELKHVLTIFIFYLLTINLNFILFQITQIGNFDLKLFPNNAYITFQKLYFFSFYEYLNYLYELSFVMFYLLPFIILIFIKDKLDFVSNQRNIEIIKQKETENLLLKSQLSQINPHFIYNTLNFISTKASKSSLELQNAINIFSEIIQYSLEGSLKGDIQDGILQTTALSEEIRHLENYIEIHRKRYDGNIFVNLDIDGSTEYKVILPLILINYVENAFKYGIFQDEKYPLIIRIKIQNGVLAFNVKNKKNKTKVLQKSTGIGNERTLRRIQFAYPERYSFDILDELDFYTISLTINL